MREVKFKDKQYTGLNDCESDEIFKGDSVEFLGVVGKIVFECGAFGIGFDECINYDVVQSKMDAFGICCGNKYNGCYNDNFISLWEICWNFSCYEDYMYPIKIIHEN